MFCPRRLETCGIEPGCKSIVYFTNFSKRWPIKFETSLTQAKAMTFESIGFVLEDSIVQVEAKPSICSKIPSTKVFSGLYTNPLEVPKCSLLSVPPSAFKFILGVSSDFGIGFSVGVQGSSDGHKHPSMRNGKMFRFVLHSSFEEDGGVQKA